MIEPVEVVQLPTYLRIFSAGLWLFLVGLFYMKAWNPAPGVEWLNAVAIGIAFYIVLYWMRAPAVVARADDAGLTYVDTRLGLLLMYGEHQAAWPDVVAVETRRHQRRYGWYLQTRVTVRDEGGDGTRHFNVTSMSRGYRAFLDALRTRTTLTVPEQPELSDDPARAAAALHSAAVQHKRVYILLIVLMAATTAFAVLLARR